MVSVSASKRLGSGVVARALLRSVKLDREEAGPGLSVRPAAKIPCRGNRGAGANGRMSSSTSAIGDMACSSLACDSEEAEVFREWPRLLVPGCN